MKKLVSLLLICVLAIGSFGACGKKNDDKEETKTPNTGNEQGNTPAAGKDENPSPNDSEAEALGLPAMTTENITLTYACWGQQEKGEIEAREKQIAAFMEAYPNIKVEFVNIDQAQWADSLTTLAATGDLPDVFWVFSVTDAIMNEWALDVTEFYEKDPAAREVYPSLVSNSMVNNRLYSMPTVMFPCVIFLNKTVFAKYNVPLPSYDWTVDDFISIAKEISHPEEFYFGTSNPIYPDYFQALYSDTQSIRGWDGQSYSFDQTWVDAVELKYDFIDSKVCEWAPEEEKERWLGDPYAWPPGFGRSAMHWDWTWTIAYFEDAVTAQSGCEFLYYPQPQGPSGKQMAVVDYGVISAATDYPREAWELQKWTSWGKEACLNRMEGYKEAGLNIISRMPVINNAEVWEMAKQFTDREDIKATYDRLDDIVPTVGSVAPGYGMFDAWANENGIWAQLDERVVSPADIADELTKKANEFRDEWLKNLP